MGDGNFNYTEVRERADSVINLWDPVQQFKLENGDRLKVMGSLEVKCLYQETATEEPGVRVTDPIKNMDFSLKGIKRFTIFQPQTIMKLEGVSVKINRTSDYLIIKK